MRQATTTSANAASRRSAGPDPSKSFICSHFHTLCIIRLPLTPGVAVAILSKMSFVHLHCHSEYSLLDGANRIEDLIARALEFEQPALAITDHGNLHAAWEFQEKAKKAGLKPIIGMEAYVAPGDRRTRGRPAPGVKPYYHLILLARDMQG